MYSKRFSSGNLRDFAAPSEQDYQQTGIGINSEIEFASPGIFSENASHAHRHDLSMNVSRNNTISMQAAYHIAKNYVGAHSEGVDGHPTTLFT